MTPQTNFPINVTYITQDVLTGELCFSLTAYYRGKPVTKTVKRGELTVRTLNELATFGFPILQRKIAEDFVKYVIDNEGYFRLRRVCGKVGWHDVDGKLYFIHHMAFCDGKWEDIRYNGPIDLSHKGTFEANVKFLNELFSKGLVGLQAVCAVSLSSAVVGLLSEKDLRYIFHIGGTSTTGKTTSLMLAASMWGNPDISPHCVASNWHVTDNKLVQSMSGNKGILRGLDELSMLNADRTKLTYILTGGSDKQRMTDEAGIDSEFRTVIISTGELSFRDSNYGGIGVRLLETSGFNFTETKENADWIRDMVFKNYGNIGCKFAQILTRYEIASIYDALNHYTNKVNKRIEKTLAKKGGVYSPLYGRIAEKIAAIVLAADFAKSDLGLNFAINDIISFLIKDTTLLSGGQEQADEAMERILELYTKNQTKFPKQLTSSVSNLWGRTIMSGDKLMEIIILYDQFVELMRKNGYPDTCSLLHALRDKGYINCEPDKLYSRRKVGDTQRAKVVVVNVSAFNGRERK